VPANYGRGHCEKGASDAWQITNHMAIYCFHCSRATDCWIDAVCSTYAYRTERVRTHWVVILGWVVTAVCRTSSSNSSPGSTGFHGTGLWGGGGMLVLEPIAGPHPSDGPKNKTKTWFGCTASC
jgi:hypothetical protein